MDKTLYFLFDNTLSAQPGAGGCYGIFHSWEEIYAEANQYENVTIATVVENKLQTVARLSDGCKWYFEKECPFYPFKFDKADPVKYLEGGKQRIGNIAYGMYIVRWDEKIEITYVVNNTFVDESQLSKINTN